MHVSHGTRDVGAWLLRAALRWAAGVCPGPRSPARPQDAPPRPFLARPRRVSAASPAYRSAKGTSPPSSLLGMLKGTPCFLFKRRDDK